MWLKQFCKRSPGYQPRRSTYSVVFGYSTSSGRVIDDGILGDVNKHTQNCKGELWLFRNSPLGMWFGQCERLAVAIVAITPQSLWTPLQWGRGSFVSCTVYTFTLTLQWWHPHSYSQAAAFGDLWSTGMSFLQLSEEELPVEKHLQINLELWRSITNFNTDIRHTFTFVRTYLPLYNEVGALVFQCEMTINNSTLFVQQKSISWQGSVSTINTYTDTDSTTDDWDQEAAYRNQQRSSCQHNTTGLCITFSGVVDWKSRELMPTAQSTA